MRNKLLVIFWVVISATIMMFYYNINNISEKSSTEKIINYLERNIWNEKKINGVDKALAILNDRELHDKTQVYFNIVVSSDKAKYNSDINVKKVVDMILNKNNYVSKEDFLAMVNQYSDFYFSSKDDNIKEIIIKCFNEDEIYFYPNNEELFIENMFNMKHDFNDAEMEMASGFLENILLLDNSRIDLNLFKTLVTKLIDSSERNEPFYCERYLSLIQNYFERRYQSSHGVREIVNITNKIISLGNQLAQLNSELGRLISENGVHKKEGASKYIQSEYDKMIKDPNIMREYTDLFGSEKAAKDAIMAACIVSASKNGYYEYVDNRVNIENKENEISKIQNELDLLSKQLENETTNFLNIIDLKSNSKEYKENENINKVDAYNDANSLSSIQDILKELIINFDNAWIEYVNNDVTTIYNYIVPGSQVESYIRSFSNTGVMEEFLLIEVKEAEVIDKDAYVKVHERIKKVKNGEETIKEYNWIYHCMKVNGQWLVNDYVEDNSSSVSEINRELTEDWVEQSIDFKGYGTTKGGTLTDGIDIGKIRWRKHDGYERIILDMHEFTYSDPGNAVDMVCQFEVKYAENTDMSIVTLNGARGIGAEVPDVSDSDYISNILKSYPGDDSTSVLIIEYKKPIELRIFELHDPGRIVIDVREKN